MLTLDRTCVEHWFPWAAGVDVPKIAPDDVAHQVFDAVEAGEIRLSCCFRGSRGLASAG